MIELTIRDVQKEDPTILLDLSALLTKIALANTAERNNEAKDVVETDERIPNAAYGQAFGRASRETLFQGPGDQFTEEELIESETKAVGLEKVKIEKAEVDKLFNKTFESPAPSKTATHFLLPGGVDLDAEGLPWDRRIHSRTKSKLSDGTWRKQRGVDEKLIHQVENELRSAMNSTVRAAVPQIPTPPVAMPKAVIPTPPSAPPVLNTADIYNEFMEFINPLVTTKRITRLQIAEILQMYGIANLPLLLNRPDLIPTITTQIKAIAGV